MNKHKVRSLVVYARAEVYLRFRYASLHDDHTWLSAPAHGRPPSAVVDVLETVCMDCLEDAVETGDWAAIDELLISATPTTTTTNLAFLN